MSPVFITAIQFSKCAALTRGNFIIPLFIPFVKHFFHFFCRPDFPRFPLAGRPIYIITSLPVCQVLFSTFFVFLFFYAIAEFSALAFIFSYIII